MNNQITLGRNTKRRVVSYQIMTPRVKGVYIEYIKSVHGAFKPKDLKNKGRMVAFFKYLESHGKFLKIESLHGPWGIT